MSVNNIRVLLVEDNRNACYEFEECMKDWGEFTLVARTGRQSEAIEYVMSREVDAVILDLELEEGDGIGFLEELKGKVVDKPFIIVTTNTLSETILQMVRERGADFIYQKTNLNYSPHQILDFIKKSIKFHMPAEKNTYMSNKEYVKAKEDEMFKRHVAMVLAGMGFLASYKGTNLVRDAIIIVADNENMMQVTKHVYPLLAKRYDMTPNSVEKNIRTAIEQTWLNSDPEKLAKAYPFAINSDNGRPTNMNFICNMSGMLKNY